MKRPFYLCLLASLAVSIATAQEPTEKLDVPYVAKPDADPHTSERCRLDLYLPAANGNRFPILVWFHGGGLEGGERNGEQQKQLARRLAAQGVGVAMAGYRLSPKVHYPIYLQDSAKAVAWVTQHAAELGSDPSLVYVGGHSAGGYLSAMLAMDPRYLQEAGVDPAKLGGFIPMSGQMMTHFTIRKERGVTNSTSLVAADEAAPIFHLRKDAPRLLLLIGDKDWPARKEENAYFAAALREVAKHENSTLIVVPERDHGSILSKCLEPGDPAGEAMLRFMHVNQTAN